MLTDKFLSQIQCSEHEIETTIEVLNPNKASGDDGISHKMPKVVSKSVLKSLCILKNRSFSEGIFPDIWKLAIVISILRREINLNPLTIDQLNSCAVLENYMTGLFLKVCIIFT